MIRKVVRVLLPLVALFLGVVVMMGLVKTKPKATKQVRIDPGTVVESERMKPETQPVVVKAHGTVVPARAVVVAPEVNGKVIAISEQLVPGGRFEKGETMFRLDGRDYRLALEAQSAAVDQAETALAMEQRRKKIAEREWELMGKEGDPVTLSEKQVKSAEAAAEAARSHVSRARLNIGRTVVKAPFNAIVQQRNLDVGQIIGPATPAVTLAGTDEFWVQISVPVDRLVWLDVPGLNVQGRDNGSVATVWREINGQRIERKGRVVRLLGDVDPMGRMARLLVAISDPLGIRGPADPVTGEVTTPAAQLPLLLGSFVQVDVEGRKVDGVLELPREALRDGDKIYVMKPEKVDLEPWLRDMMVWADDRELAEISTIHRLDIRPVDVVWRQRDVVYVRTDLAAGETIVTSPVPAPIQDMKLRAPAKGSGITAATGAATDTKPAGEARP